MDTNKEKILSKHCHTEYHPETGELMVRSSEAAVMIAMVEYAQQVSKPIIEMLKAAQCRNRTCDLGILYLNGMEQCQWCDERDKLIEEYEKLIK